MNGPSGHNVIDYLHSLFMMVMVVVMMALLR